LYLTPRSFIRRTTGNKLASGSAERAGVPNIVDMNLRPRRISPRPPIGGYRSAEEGQAARFENPTCRRFAPAGTEAFFRDILPSDIGLIDAWLPSLGDCLVHTIKEIFARGHAAAVVLNSDSPTLPTALLVETADMLTRPGERAVLGPSTDGGYYLLGLKTVHRRLFEDIGWGTERVAAQTLERARELKLDLHMLPPWYDVDDVDGLRRLHGELGSARAAQAKLDPHTPYYPAATATLMHSLAAGERLECVPQMPLGSA
jgi:glycosyltransferase A (GT-A) superfamily protein (DUF2064 family)